jgi:uncharacterized protein (TIGR00251 family)
MSSAGWSGKGRIRVRVTPRARREAVDGFDAEGRLRVRLTAPPVEGEANRALTVFLARRLGVPRRAVTLVRGETARDKLIEVEGFDDESLRAALAALCPNEEGRG